jgi:hypothetical protein
MNHKPTIKISHQINCAVGYTADQHGAVLMADLWYPRHGDIQFIKIELVDPARQAKGIRLSYDFDRDGWMVEQQGASAKFQEVAFVQAWARQDHTFEVTEPEAPLPTATGTAFATSHDGDTATISVVDPASNGGKYIELGLLDVRAADDIRITFDFERGGWSILQASRFQWSGDDVNCNPDWQEVTFVNATL